MPVKAGGLFTARLFASDQQVKFFGFWVQICSVVHLLSCASLVCEPSQGCMRDQRYQARWLFLLPELPALACHPDRFRLVSASFIFFRTDELGHFAHARIIPQPGKPAHHVQHVQDVIPDQRGFEFGKISAYPEKIWLARFALLSQAQDGLSPDFTGFALPPFSGLCQRF